MIPFHKIEHILITFSISPDLWQKLWWQHIWPNLQQEMRADEVLAAVLQPALTLVKESSNSEYEAIILPTFK